MRGGGGGVVFGRKLDRPRLSLSGTAEEHFRVRVKLPVCAAFCSGTGLRSRNSQTCTTRFRISDLGNLVQIFRHFRYGASVRLTNHSYWDRCLRWFMRVKIMFILIETSPGLGMMPFPISMVLRSEESLKSEMLSLARTSKYLKKY